MAAVIATISLGIGLIIGLLYFSIGLLYLIFVQSFKDPAARQKWIDDCPTFYKAYKKLSRS